MKTIRPIGTPKKDNGISVKKDENKIADIKNENDVFQDLCINDKKEQTFEKLMDEVLVGSRETVTFEITLTKKQYELYTAKGGLRWLKKQISGINTKGRKR